MAFHDSLKFMILLIILIVKLSCEGFLTVTVRIHVVKYCLMKSSKITEYVARPYCSKQILKIIFIQHNDSDLNCIKAC